MPVVILLPGPLQAYAGGRDAVRLDEPCPTVRDALDALARCHPGVRDRVLTEQGDVRPHLNVFVGTENVRFARGLATPVPPDGRLTILPAVSGG